MVKYGSLPFQEQIQFFRNKDLVPTERWNDLTREMHDTGFMVAGAIKADLLTDLKKIVGKAIKDGTTLAEFRNDFDAVVAHHGWTGWTGEDTKAGRAWRTKIIYDTNLRTSYQAGRWQQVQKVKKTRPYLIYKHSDSVISPREEHVKWHNLVVHQDDPWVTTHWPPNGFGCKCKMFSLSKRDLQKLGKSGPDTPPDDGVKEWTDPKTGEVVTTPAGIQPYWDYTPGASLQDRVAGQLARKAEGLPDDIGNQLMAFIKSSRSVAQAEKTALDLGVKNVNYASNLQIANVVNHVLDDLKNKGLSIPDSIIVNEGFFQRFADQLGDDIEDFAAAFSPHSQTHATFFVLNPRYQYWHDPKQDSVKQFNKGEWSTDSEFHIFNHEMGHLNHYKIDQENYTRLYHSIFHDTDKATAKLVSKYAAKAPIEFVAEVFAGLLTGKSFNGQIMALYKKLKGPLP